MRWNDKEQDRQRLFTRRAALIAGGKLALISTLIGRMYYLQVVESDRYQKLAESNRINVRLLAPPRGLILDRNGAPLASNEQNYRVELVAEQTGDAALTLDALAELIQLDERDRRRILRDIKRKRSFVPVLIRDNLSWEELSRIEVNLVKLPGINIEAGLTRSYPYGETTAHVLGYVAPVSEAELTGDPMLELPELRIGKSGIERFHDLDLRGQAGTSEVEVNVLGRVIRELAREEGKSGETIGLTIDIGLQNMLMARLASERVSRLEILEREARQRKDLSGANRFHEELLHVQEPGVYEQSSAAVVMSVTDGEILALGSYPSYDPAAFARGLTTHEWHTLQESGALNDKAIAGQYPPGSTFKTVIALAALESGVMTAQQRFTCPGVFHLGNVEFHCWNHRGHGSIAMADAITQSCDVYFFNVAHTIGLDRIAAMARRLGLGSDYGFDLPGVKAGLVPSNEWKKATTGAAFTPGDTVNLGIGQGYLLATPLQLATMAARIASGRAVVPHLTREIIEPSGRREMLANEFPDLGISPASLAVVRAGMDGVSNGDRGTARSKDQRIAEPSMRMAGKTGSAQVRRITQHDRDTKNTETVNQQWKYRDHALFISFAPVPAPAYCCAVVVEHGAHGGWAAPIARDLLYEAQLRDIAKRGVAESRETPSKPKA
jgi:penicillin-binding protein 2